MTKDLYTELSVITKDQREIFFQPNDQDEDQQIILDISKDQVSFSFGAVAADRGYNSQKITFGKEFLEIEKNNYADAELISAEKHRFMIINGHHVGMYNSEINGEKNRVTGQAQVEPIFKALNFDGLELATDIDTRKLATLNFADITTDYYKLREPSSRARVLSANQEKFLQGFFSKPVLPVSEAWDMYQKYHPEKLLKLKKL